MIVICIVGTKNDLQKERVIRREEGEALALKLGCLFFEVTSIEGDSVEKAFTQMFEEIDLTKVQKTTSDVMVDEETEKKSCC